MKEKKEKTDDVVPEIKMTDILNGNFFRVHYPLEDSEFPYTSMPREDNRSMR